MKTKFTKTYDFKSLVHKSSLKKKSRLGLAHQGVRRLFPLPSCIPLAGSRGSPGYRYSLMSSSLTAEGVSTPRSVNSSVIKEGEV